MIPANEVLIVEPSTAFSTLLKQLIFQSHGYHADVAHDIRSLRSLLERKAKGFFVAVINLQVSAPLDTQAIDLCAEANIPTLAFVPSHSAVRNLQLWQHGIADYAFKTGAHSLEHIVWSINRSFLNRQTKLLLGVSDSPEFMEINKRLKQLGFDINRQENEDSIMLSLHQDPTIEMVVLDCTQSTFSGLHLLGEFRETHSMVDLEVIAVTDDPSLAATLYKSGANDVIPIPFLPECLVHSINQSADRLDQSKQLKLLQQDKIHLLTNAAHDIRSPISAIKSAADMLLDKNTPPMRIRPLVNMIGNNASSVLRLIEQLLDLSVLSHGKLNLQIDSIDLSKLVEERVALHHIEAETKQTKIRMDNHPKVIIKGDKLKLKQIIDTLIGNALQVSDSNNTIEITTAQSQQSAFFRIVDSGAEIPREEINCLFKSYTNNKDSDLGHKGLSLLKTLVESHNGRIYYNRDKSEHNVFSVELPII